MPLREKDLINFSKQAKAEKERKERLFNAVEVERVIDKILSKGSDVTFSSDDLVGVAGFSGCAHANSNCELTAETREACATDTARAAAAAVAAASARVNRRSPTRQRSVTRSQHSSCHGNSAQPAQSSTARAPRTPPPVIPHQGSPIRQRQRSVTRGARESTSCAAQLALRPASSSSSAIVAPSQSASSSASSSVATTAAAVAPTAAYVQTAAVHHAARAPRTPPPQYQGSPVRGRQRSVTRPAHQSPTRPRESTSATAVAAAPPPYTHAPAPAPAPATTSVAAAPPLAPAPLAPARNGQQQHVQYAVPATSSTSATSAGIDGGHLAGAATPAHAHHTVPTRTHAVPHMVPLPIGHPATAMMSAVVGKASLDNHNHRIHHNAYAFHTAHQTAALNASKKRQRVQPQSIIRTRQQRRLDAEELNVTEENIAAAPPTPMAKP